MRRPLRRTTAAEEDTDYDDDGGCPATLAAHGVGQRGGEDGSLMATTGATDAGSDDCGGCTASVTAGGVARGNRPGDGRG